MIELNKVVKTFKTKKGNITAVDHVDLNIDKGSIYGVIGFLVQVKVRLYVCLMA